MSLKRNSKFQHFQGVQGPTRALYDKLLLTERIPPARITTQPGLSIYFDEVILMTGSLCGGYDDCGCMRRRTRRILIAGTPETIEG